jgi:GT2 family glycosyltransferase
VLLILGALLFYAFFNRILDFQNSSSMAKISAVIITYNEEENIGRCIDSLISVADEILIVDSYSKDKTKEECLKRSVKFIQHPFYGHVEQKNYALENAKYDYVISLDGDEYLSEELAQSILGVKENLNGDAYFFSRLSSYEGKWIRYTDWYPDRKLRLWNRNFGKWGGANPHDKVILNQKADIKLLKGELLHKAYKDADQLVIKANQYSSLFAQSARVLVGSSYFKIIYKTIYTFFRNYFLRAGFLSGLAGLQISFANATYTFFKYSKLLALNRSLPVFSKTKSNFKPNGISVVIPNYNGRKLFPHTISPLISVMESATLPYEIIISDDCSTDDSVDFLNQNFPSITVIRGEMNKGFSATINRGIFQAKYDLVLLLNSDIILTEGYFTHQLKYFDDKDTFGVMGRIIGWNDEKIQDAARLPEFHGLKIKTSGNYLLKPMGEESLYTLYLSGANALVNRRKLIELGGFDEIFSPFYIEDCDLSFRAWRLGWKCYYEHRAICRHQTSSSVKAKNKKQYVDVIYNRNKLFLHAIHLDSHQLPFWFIQVTVEALARILIFRTSFIKSISLFIKHRKDWRKSRAKYQTLMAERGEEVSLVRIANGIKESLYQRKKTKFLSTRSE